MQGNQNRLRILIANVELDGSLNGIFNMVTLALPLRDRV